MSVTSYTQGHDTHTLQSHSSRTAAVQADYLIPHIHPDHHILDVGCGPGTITCDFAALASRGNIVGIDYSDDVLVQARREASTRGLTNITFQSGSAFSLPFADETFDVVHCHAVLTHLPNAVAAVREMRRVCKPGGYVAAREPDWDTCVIHPRDEVLERWKEVDRVLKRNQGAEPNAGRFLAQWAVEAGFERGQVWVGCNVLEYSDPDGVRWWGELYAQRMRTEFGKRAVDAGLVTEEEVDRMSEAWLEWSRCEVAMWAMMHVRLLARK